MEYINFNIKSKNGMFYTTSKEEKKGYTLNKYIDRETNAEKVNFHKDVRTLSGKLIKFGVKESQFGEQFFIFLKQEEECVHALQINVFRKGTAINDYIKSFAQYVDQLKEGDNLEIYLNNKAKDKNGYLYKNVYISSNGESLKWSFPIYGEGSPVPNPAKTINKVTGKEVWDYSDVDAFFYKKIKESNISEKEAPETEVVKDAIVEPVDDLPF
jgi:hypothetical protein